MENKTKKPHQVHGESNHYEIYDPIRRDHEFNILIEKWIRGEISYEEMKRKHKNSEKLGKKKSELFSY